MLEIKGRLHLWHLALVETASVLGLASRADQRFNSEDAKSTELRYLQRLQEFARKQPDYDPLMQKGHHAQEFERLHPQEFPTLVECVLLRDNLVMFAIVLFSQIFTSGSGSQGSAASNRPSVMGDERRTILANAFPDEMDRKKFEAFSQGLLQIRNNVLGHANAEEFDVQHGSSVTSIRMHYVSTRSIDLNYWSSVLEPLRLAILHRTGQL